MYLEFAVKRLCIRDGGRVFQPAGFFLNDVQSRRRYGVGGKDEAHGYSYSCAARFAVILARITNLVITLLVLLFMWSKVICKIISGVDIACHLH
jgi:hypothetical protein